MARQARHKSKGGISLKIGFVALAALFLWTANACALPLSAYGQLPTLSNVTLSPNGKMVAYIHGKAPNRFIVIQSIDVPKPLAVLDVGDAKLRALEWADNRYLIIINSVTALPMGLIGHRAEFFMAQSYDTQTGSLSRLLDHTHIWDSDLRTMNVVTDIPRPRTVDGHTVVFVRGIYFPDRQARFALFRVDLASGEGRMVSSSGDTHGEQWVVNGDGHIVAEADYYESDKHWELRLYHEGEPDTVVNVAAPIEGPAIEGLNANGTALVLSLPQTEDWPAYEQISLKDGSVSPWPYADLHLDDLISDSRTGRVVGGPRFSDKNDYVFFDPHAAMVWRSIKAAFAGATNVSLVSWSEDRSEAVVLVFGPAYGDTYYFVDMTTHRASPIGPAYDGVDNVFPVQWITYRAADGLELHAYLTLPPDRVAKSLPLIVLPHGGPHARDEPGFDWISQALASRGYAVFQPEFRGSAGFGRDLLWAGFGQFGRKMQTDLSDGVRALSAQGLIDPKRVCIVGASYGGYAALAGATLDPGVYRCAVSIAGISDLQALLSHWDWPHNTLDDRNARFWDRFLGVKEADDPALDAISPIKHIDKVSIPILLIHGRDDTIVPFSQSDDMVDALKDAGKQVQFVKLDGEDHWLSRSQTRLQALDATVKFLLANDPPN